MSSHLDTFLEGWRKGDAAMILRAVADDFVYDDPIDGRFSKAEFAAYLEELLARDAEASGADAGEDFETITDVVRELKDGEETLWAWWKTPTEEGASVVKAGPDGVHSEKLTYYTRPAPS
jgi:hypothetical protein